MGDSLDRRQKAVEQRFQTMFATFPEALPLDLKVLHKRWVSGSSIWGYEEWKIEYSAEGPDTMPEASLRKVPAYLLVPQRTSAPESSTLIPQLGVRRAPFPAMVCFHQCFCDCDVGKDAVIGRQIDRPDQAYGYELVQQGFVVIAPDSINCAERRIPSLRPEGRRMAGNSLCFSEMPERTGRSWHEKTILDGMRAVDLLQSLDFVDSDRIGVIGHSLGAMSALLTMVADQRIKAGIISGEGYVGGYEHLAVLAPRLFMQLRGSYDGSPEVLRRVEEAHEFARAYYEKEGASENLVLRVLPHGHHFADEFKREAYARLKLWFGSGLAKKQVLLEDVLRGVQQSDWPPWPNGATLELPGIHWITGDEAALNNAFCLLFAVLFLKIPADSSISVRIDAVGDECSVVCSIPGGDDAVRTTHDHVLGQVEQTFYEHSASLRRENTSDELRYAVTFETN